MNEVVRPRMLGAVSAAAAVALTAGLAGCTVRPLNVVTPAAGRDAAVVTADYSRSEGPWTIRLGLGQRLVPATVNNQNGWCSTTMVYVPNGWVINVARLACFADPNNSGRLEWMVPLGAPFQRTQIDVDIPYAPESEARRQFTAEQSQTAAAGERERVAFTRCEANYMQEAFGPSLFVAVVFSAMRLGATNCMQNWRATGVISQPDPPAPPGP